MALQDEERWFESNRAYIAQQYQGQWLVVVGTAVRGAYPSQGDAFNAAVKQFGPQAGFLIKQAVPAEPIQKVGTWEK
jgi:hypothetical protein